MQKFFLFALAILISCLAGGEGQGYAGEHACNRVSNVEIRYKDYFEIYLGFNRTSQSVGEDSFFYNYIKAAVNECCNFMDLNFTKLNSSEMEVEEIALWALVNDTAIPRPFVFYFPEFATGKEKIVYDFELSFIKLSRSPGQAVIMLKPDSKEQVSLFHIFKESTPMLAMMLAMSWLVGILGWIAVSIKPG
jgi:F0F1-type ATP synthase membrane subunit c/vacuolar-type H+-ATPase subunit K